MVKGFFGLTFDGVRDNKNGTKKKASSTRKRKKAIIIHQKYIICEKPACKNLKAYYYAFLKIAPKGGAPCNNSGYECCERKEGRNNRKEYHSISRARKVRSEIVALYCNILKVSQVLAFSTLGCYSFPFYRRMERAPG